MSKLSANRKSLITGDLRGHLKEVEGGQEGVNEIQGVFIGTIALPGHSNFQNCIIHGAKIIS